MARLRAIYLFATPCTNARRRISLVFLIDNFLLSTMAAPPAQVLTRKEYGTLVLMPLDTGSASLRKHESGRDFPESPVANYRKEWSGVIGTGGRDFPESVVETFRNMH